jgi:methylthioribose-1-phosphate isomerase
MARGIGRMTLPDHYDQHVNLAATAPPPLRWDGECLHVLDQTWLPARERVLALSGAADTADAIRRLAVRGAPLIGVVAGYGLAMEVGREPGLGALDRGAEVLRAARPTAANLGWAVDRVAAAARAAGPAGMAGASRAEAEAIEAENAAAGAALSQSGADLLAGVGRVLTHCNTGALACGTRGSALGVIMAMAERNPRLHVLVCETRPLLQGARLTTWELRRTGIEHELIVDAAAAGLIRSGEVDAVVVGFDRMAASGDTANKVGTYGHALAARAAGIPFVFAGPVSSIDPSLAAGEDIVIEERDADEVRHAGDALLTIPDTPVRNPAFDVTPADLVTAVVTERGIARPVGRDTVAALLR